MVAMITIDLDEPQRLDIIKSWKVLEYMGFTVQGRVSSSGTGVHLRADRPGGVERLGEVRRRIAGDDPKRIDLDIERSYRPAGVLFDSKDGDHAGTWVGDMESLLRGYEYHG